MLVYDIQDDLVEGVMEGTWYMYTRSFRDDFHGSSTYELIGGPKAYLRVWDSGEREWSWALNDHNVETTGP